MRCMGSLCKEPDGRCSCEAEWQAHEDELDAIREGGWCPCDRGPTTWEGVCRECLFERHSDVACDGE